MNKKLIQLVVWYIMLRDWFNRTLVASYKHFPKLPGYHAFIKISEIFQSHVFVISFAFLSCNLASFLFFLFIFYFCAKKVRHFSMYWKILKAVKDCDSFKKLTKYTKKLWHCSLLHFLFIQNCDISQKHIFPLSAKVNANYSSFSNNGWISTFLVSYFDIQQVIFPYKKSRNIGINITDFCCI